LYSTSQQGGNLLFVFLCFFGVVGNVLVLSVFLKPKMRTAANYLIGNLAMADLGLCLSGLPILITNAIAGKWDVGEGGCAFFGMCTVVFCAESLFMLAIIACDRYVIIVRQKKNQS